MGRVRYLTKGGKHQEKKDMALKQVAMEVESKYYHDTIYCMPSRAIYRKLENMMSIFKEGKSRLLEGRDTLKVVQEYKDLILDKDKLFDAIQSFVARKYLVTTTLVPPRGELCVGEHST